MGEHAFLAALEVPQRTAYVSKGSPLWTGVAIEKYRHTLLSLAENLAYEVRASSDP